jgi:hypothetical protein
MRGSIVSVLLCCDAASEAPRADRRQLAAYDYQEVAKLTAADAGDDEFGRSVAIDGDTIVVGAYGKDSWTGAAYVFRTPDGGATYDQVAKLTASDAAEDDYFGRDVAIDGDTVSISGGGSVYILHTTDGGGTWSQVAKLVANDGVYINRPAISGDVVVAGALSDNNDRGSAYVFRTTDGGASYGQVTKLRADNGALRPYFGYSVAISGDVVVAGASGDNNRGAAYVFRTTDGGATYGQVARLTASDAARDDKFGISVAIDGGTVVVGAYWKGAVYVFRTSDGGATYIELAKLTAADGARGDEFGISVAIDGGTIVVGAPDDHDGGDWSGSVYVFRTADSGATYSQVAKLTAADAASSDGFGCSVAIAGDTIVVGTENKEAAYVFDATSQPKPQQKQQQQDLLATILIPTAAAVLVLWCLYFVLTAKNKQPVPHAREGAASNDPTVPSAPPLPPLPPPSAPPHFRYGEAECATPVAVQVARPEVARPVAGTSTAPFATVVNVQRVVRGWSARGLQRLASWRATPEEEV